VAVLFGLKYLKREIAQVVHPKAVLPIKIDRVTVPGEIQRQILGFVLFYIALMTLSSLVVTMIEHDAVVGTVGTAATIGNIGPGYGTIGPMGSFGGLSPWTKMIFIVDMVVGRLELIPFLAMLHPDFWTFKRGASLKKNKHGARHESGRVL
jgi:trk system potassium uptake protein TrkH